MNPFNIVDLIKYKEHYDWEYNSNNYSTEELYKVMFSPTSIGFGVYNGVDMHKIGEKSFLLLRDYTFIGGNTICRPYHKIWIDTNLKLVPLRSSDLQDLFKASKVIESMCEDDYEKYSKILLVYLKAIARLAIERE